MAKSKFDDMVIFGDGLGGFISMDPNFNAEEYAEHIGGRTTATQGSSESTPEDAYKDLDGKGLKELAASREVDITGLKTKKEVIGKLVEADAAEAAAKAAEDAASGDDSSDNN